MSLSIFAIPYKAAYGPQVRESVGHKQENNGVIGYEACTSQMRRQKTKLKGRGDSTLFI
jgi:hypothetical protein